MTWSNPPPIVPTKAKAGKRIAPKMIAGDSESSQQKALMVWAANSVGKYPQLKWLFHIPNGGTRNVREAVELKAQGVKAGIPDLMLPCAMYDWNDLKLKYCKYHGLFIEMKIEKYRNRKNGGCSDEQIEWIVKLRETYCVVVCYGWEEASYTLINYLEGKL